MNELGNKNKKSESDMKQQQAVIEYFIQNNNEAMHYSDIAQELNIIVNNMRRILGQGEKKDIFSFTTEN